MEVVLYGDTHSIHRCRGDLSVAKRTLEDMQRNEARFELMEKVFRQSVVVTADWRYRVKLDGDGASAKKHAATGLLLLEHLKRVPAMFDGLVEVSQLPVLRMDESGNFKRSLLANGTELVCEALSERVRLGTIVRTCLVFFC